MLSKYGKWETRGEKVDAAAYSVASTHHFHGDTCLCGADSATARGRTEHIIDATLASLVGAEILGSPKSSDPSTKENDR